MADAMLALHLFRTNSVSPEQAMTEQGCADPTSRLHMVHC